MSMFDKTYLRLSKLIKDIETDLEAEAAKGRYVQHELVTMLRQLRTELFKLELGLTTQQILDLQAKGG